MKRTALSIFFMLVFSAYSFFERTSAPTYIATNTSVAEQSPTTVAAASGPDNANIPLAQDILPAPPVSRSRARDGSEFEDDGYGEYGYGNSVAQSLPIQQTQSVTPAVQPVQTPVQPQSQPAPQPVVQAAPTNKIYKDGAFTGASADAYYGNVQVRVTTKNDRITDVQFLDYPRDRNTSVSINTYATPILRSEAIQIQGAQVDTVSGASATSGAFRESLASALALARI